MAANPRQLPLRQYQPLWNAIKLHGLITINAPARLHKRICKAVIKEKWKDFDWKDSEGWRMKWLTYSCNAEANQITFRLEYKLKELMPYEL